jgi:hypothetical protein
MNITVSLASRGNPLGLQSTIVSCSALASGVHPVRYAIGIDEDDPATLEAIESLSRKVWGVTPVRGPAPEALGEALNGLLDAVPGDVCVFLGDRTFILTPRWDLVIAQALSATPHGVFWQTHPDLRTSCIFPVISRHWLDAARPIFTNYFPFWFDDTWLAELWLFATGAAPIMLPTHAFRQAHKTARLRDLEFWYRFFFALRPMRIQRGREIGSRLGLPPVDADRIRVALERNDAELLSRVPQIEAEYGVPGTVPDERYLQAKARAETLLAGHLKSPIR